MAGPAGVGIASTARPTQVRRPQAHRPGRCAFVSGKKKQNTMKTTTISDGQGRTLWSGADRPGRMHDQTAMRTEGIAEQFRLHPDVRAEVDEGYRGLANEFPKQVSAPPKKPKVDAPPRSVTSTPGVSNGAASPRRGSASNTPTPSTSSGALCSVSSAAASTTRPRTEPSQAWFPTEPPSAPHGANRAPNSCPSAR